MDGPSLLREGVGVLKEGGGKTLELSLQITSFLCWKLPPVPSWTSAPFWEYMLDFFLPRPGSLGSWLPGDF